MTLPRSAAQAVQGQGDAEAGEDQGELASLYIDSFERVWDTATPVDGE